MSILDTIQSPRDLQKLSASDLDDVADALRRRIISVVKTNGGHLASNLGVVELTIALHRVFRSPIDKLVFDVSHQTYAHKLLTGRNDFRFDKLRMTDGYSGFSSPSESKHDIFVAGHAGTALSVALGLAYARDSLCQDHHVVAILGDASLSCGMTMEALNCVSSTTARLIVIINDNEFSISKNVGAISLYLNEIMRSRLYSAVTRFLKKIIGAGKFGRSVINNVRNIKRAVKGLLLPTSYFEYYGLRYVGPVDGHNISQLEEALQFCKKSTRPVILHVKTTKGKGLQDAVLCPEKYHGVNPVGSISDLLVDYSNVLGRELVSLAKNDRRIVGVTAAMAHGTGLWRLRDEVPSQFFDVGISEEHAVTFCAAMAKGGMRPICAIYSTFLQRAYDQILHDVCSQNLPVVFCLDRAGIAAHDGMTHHGIFDLSYLRMIPNAVILQPWGINEFINGLHAALSWKRPVFIRYPKSIREDILPVVGKASNDIEFGKSKIVKPGKDVAIITFGSMRPLVNDVINQLQINGVDACVIDGCFIKPLDGDMLSLIHEKYRTIVTVEDNVLSGGFGSAVLEHYSSRRITPNILCFGWEDRFVGHGTSSRYLQENNGFSAVKIVKSIMESLQLDVPKSLYQ